MFHFLLHDLVPDLLGQRGKTTPVIDPDPFNKDHDMFAGREAGNYSNAL